MWAVAVHALEVVAVAMTVVLLAMTIYTWFDIRRIRKMLP